MADPAFRESQWRHRYDAHVAPLNQFIDELGRLDHAGHPPYIAPMYKGVRCHGLAVLRDPGPKAGGTDGSGFLSIENDDPTAERQHHFMHEAGIDPADVLPWNAYPWYINAKPTTRQLRYGTDPLRRVIEMLPDLRAVLLLGSDAAHAWKLFEAMQGQALRDRDLAVVECYHPSRQALFHPDPFVRAAREDSIRRAFTEYAAALAG